MAAVHPFVLERPRSVAETVASLARHGDEARIMAGGQSLTPLLTLGFSSPSVIVSLDRCRGLGQVEHRGGLLNIGARVTTAAVERDPILQRHTPLLSHAASMVGSPHVRNFGTAIGNVCHADPGSDLVPALLCHDATVRLRSSSGARTVPFERFITGPFSTTIEDSEMAVGLDVEPETDPGSDVWTCGYRKLIKRSGDLAMATCAVRLRTTAGRVSEARIALGGALSAAMRLGLLEQALIEAPVDEAGDVALGVDLMGIVGSSLMPDHHAPLDYLQLMLGRFVAATVGDAARTGPPAGSRGADD